MTASPSPQSPAILPKPAKAPSALAQAWLIARKDLAIERRTGEIVVTGGFFAALLAVLASVAFSGSVKERAQEPLLAPGAIWIAIAFAAVLSLGRTWQREREEGALDALLAGPISRPAIFIGKALAIAIFLLIIEAVVVPLVSLFFHVDLLDIGLSVAVFLGLATIGVAASGTLFGAMTVRTRARELILAAVLFPLLTPTLIVGVAATRDLIANSEAVATASAMHEVIAGSQLADLSDYVKLLVLFDVIFVIGGAILFGSVIDT
ncbi:MAG: hypothetical protein NVS3B20_09020 [Polyangiales bacterium]